MTFEIKDYFETPVILEPRVELYTVWARNCLALRLFLICLSKEQMRKNSSLFLQNLLENLLA